MTACFSLGCFFSTVRKDATSREVNHPRGEKSDQHPQGGRSVCYFRRIQGSQQRPFWSSKQFFLNLIVADRGRVRNARDMLARFGSFHCSSLLVATGVGGLPRHRDINSWRPRMTCASALAENLSGKRDCRVPGAEMRRARMLSETLQPHPHLASFGSASRDPEEGGLRILSSCLSAAYKTQGKSTRRAWSCSTIRVAERAAPSSRVKGDGILDPVPKKYAEKQSDSGGTRNPVHGNGPGPESSGEGRVPDCRIGRSLCTEGKPLHGGHVGLHLRMHDAP